MESKCDRERGSSPRVTILFFVLISLLTEIACVDFPASDKQLEKKFVRGKDEMEKLKRMMEASGMPHQQTCWKSALENLEASCKELSEERQSRLAFAFTSCFTKMTAMGEFMCEENTDIKDCFRAFDPVVMHIFHSYFIHTQDMCFFLQHQLWQEQTASAVNVLTTAAIDVAKSIEISRDTQAEILESQKESFEVQSHLARDQNDLHTKILGFKDFFDEFRNSAHEHRVIFYEMFEKLSRMQKLVGWIQGEMSFFDTMAFYLMCLVFAFVGTSTKRTHEARFWLVVLFVVSLAAERYMFRMLADDSRNFTPEEVHSYIWLLRKLTASVGMCMILTAAATYRDYNVLNNSMLGNVLEKVENLSLLLGNVAQSVDKMLPQKAVKGVELQVDRECSSGSSSSSFSDYSDESDLEELQGDDTIRPENIVAIPRTPLASGFLNKHLTNSTILSESPIQNTSVYSTPTSSHGYFLRGRSSVAKENEILQKESVTEFAKVVKQARRNSEAKYKAERASIKAYFSSDDEC